MKHNDGDASTVAGAATWDSGTGGGTPQRPAPAGDAGAGDAGGSNGCRNNSEASPALDTLLAQRWSCRGFLPQAVPRDVIEQITLAAAHAPSWCNTQPWHLHMLTGNPAERLRAAVRSEALRRTTDGLPVTPDFPFPTSFEGVYRERRRTSGWQLYDALGVQKGDRQASGCCATSSSSARPTWPF